MAASEVLDIRDYTDAIYRRRRWVVVATLVGAILALGLSMAQQKMYVSMAEVLVLPATVPGTAVSPNALISMPNELQVAKSAKVGGYAADTAATGGFSLGGVQVTNPIDTQTLIFDASATDPTAAKQTAQAYADAYIRLREENLQSSIEDRLTAVGKIIEQIQAEQADAEESLSKLGSGPAANAIQYQLTGLSNELALRQQEENDLQLAVGTAVATVIAEPVAPSGPSSPRPVRNTIIGAALGFIIGLALGLLRDRLDQRVNDRQTVESITGAPVMGVIPEAKSLHRVLALRQGGDPAAAEAFRTLRTRVIFSALKENYRSIMVTSAQPYARKTTTSANLAVALAQADTRVVLVSGDLHHPGLWRYFPERKKRGLADVLAGADDLSDVILSTDQENLLLVPSGTLEKLPEAALGSPEMLAVIEQLRERADIVILDSAPVLGVSDTLELASIVDAVILSVDAMEAKKDTLRETVEELHSVGATIMGVAFHRPEGAHFEGYAYRYRRGSGESPNGAAETVDDAIAARDPADDVDSRTVVVADRADESADASRADREGNEGSGSADRAGDRSNFRH
jgi:capsular exopolysaccharide synthesis family protein